MSTVLRAGFHRCARQPPEPSAPGDTYLNAARSAYVSCARAVSLISHAFQGALRVQARSLPSHNRATPNPEYFDFRRRRR